MVAQIVQLLLWLFLLANGGLVYTRALRLFQDVDATMDAWVSLSLAAIFLVGTAVLVYVVGGAGIAHVTALVQ